jgi:hypothetical protein
MFFTLVSRTIITKIRTPRDYLYIFLIGSVGYVALHWYLHMEKRTGITEKIRSFLYYALVLDIITAGTLLVMYPVKTKEDENTKDTSSNETENKEEVTDEQRRVMMQKMQEAKRLQQQRIREMNAQRNQQLEQNKQAPVMPNTLNDDNNERPQKPVFTPDSNKDDNDTKQQKRNTNDKYKGNEQPKQQVEEEEEDEEIKPSIFTKSSEDVTDQDVSNDKQELEKRATDEKKKGRQKEENIRDTEIPVYEGQKRKASK